MPETVSWEDERAGLLHSLALLEQENRNVRQMAFAMNQMVTILLNKTGGEAIVPGEALERVQPLPINVTPCATLPGSFTIKNATAAAPAPQILVPQPTAVPPRRIRS